MKSTVRQRNHVRVCLALGYLGLVVCLGLGCGKQAPSTAPQPSVPQPNQPEALGLKEYRGFVDSLAFSPDGKTLASGSRDKTAKLWDVASGKITADLKGHIAGVTSVAFSPDGKTLASASGLGYDPGEIKLWDVASGQNTTTLNTIQPNGGGVTSVAFSSDGKTLASGVEGVIHLWDVPSGKQIATLHGHRDLVVSVAFSPDGKTLASESKDWEVKLWDVASRKNTAVLQNGHEKVSNLTGQSVVFAPNGQSLAAANEVRNGDQSWDQFKVWDLASGQNTATLKGGGVQGTGRDLPRAMSFSPDGKILAIGDGLRIKLWDVTSGKNTGTLEGFTGNIMSVAFSPDGKTLASGAGGNTGPMTGPSIVLWEVASGNNTAPLKATPTPLRP